jgi:hypothetical protein
MRSGILASDPPKYPRDAPAKFLHVTVAVPVLNLPAQAKFRLASGFFNGPLTICRF